MRAVGPVLGAGLLMVAAVAVFKGPGLLWPTPDPREAVADLQALFPDLARLHVLALDSTDRCELFVCARGAFTTAPGTRDCDVFEDEWPERLPIDATARADLDALLRRSEEEGDGLRYAYPRYTSDGAVLAGIFSINDFSEYVLQPGYGAGLVRLLRRQLPSHRR